MFAFVLMDMATCVERTAVLASSPGTEYSNASEIDCTMQCFALRCVLASLCYPGSNTVHAVQYADRVEAYCCVLRYNTRKAKHCVILTLCTL